MRITAGEETWKAVVNYFVLNAPSSYSYI